MKVKVKTKKTNGVKGNLHERLDLLITCGHPIFVINGMICWPAEADLFFTEDEMEELKGYILSNC